MPTHLIYRGPGGRRILGKAEGFSRDYQFDRDRPLEVTSADAKALLAGPHHREFAEASDDEVAAENHREAEEAERLAAEAAASEAADLADATDTAEQAEDREV